MSHPPLPIGQLLGPDQARDACHICLAPVYAGERLKPGQRVAMAADGSIVGAQARDDVGIVDPFLKKPVKPGERCFLFVHPNTVTSLRHEWSHPKIKDVVAKLAPPEHAEEKARLQDAADAAGISYDELMEAAADFLNHGTYLSQGGRWEGHGLPDTFWDDHDAVTGTKTPGDKRWSFFSCSC